VCANPRHPEASVKYTLHATRYTVKIQDTRGQHSEIIAAKPRRALANLLHLQGAKELSERVVQNLVRQPHMVAWNSPELEPALMIELPQSKPVLRVQLAGPQGDDLGPVDLLKPSRLLGHDGRVVGEHVQRQVLQHANVLLVHVVLDRPLVVDVGQKVGVLQVLVVLRRVAEVLCGYQTGLHEVAPGAALQEGHRAAANPIGSPALLEGSDAVVLRAKGHEAPHWGVVASLDVGAEELTALAEAEGVDGRRGRENRVGGDVRACFGDVVGEVPEERGGLVARGVVGHADVVDECAWVDGFGEVAHASQAIGSKVVAQTCERRC